jgi:hypothetical protein
MDRFEAHIIRRSVAASPHYTVRFLAGDGESVTVEFHQPASDAGQEPERQTILDAARAIVSRLADQSAEQPGADDARKEEPAKTIASPSAGLSRPVDETEADTHGSEGRDTGTA